MTLKVAHLVGTVAGCKPMKVFLSHSSADKVLARRLARDLQAAKVDVWFDQWEIQVGDKFAQRIDQGLEAVDFVVVLLTRASVASEWVDREWRQKVQHEALSKRIAVIPVRSESCEIPDFLAQRAHANIGGGSYPLGFRHLLTILGHLAGGVQFATPESGKPSPPPYGSQIPIVTPIALEVGRDLIPLFEPDDSGCSRALSQLAPAMRASVEAEFGFPIPGIRIRANETDMAPRSALILIDEIPEGMIESVPEGVLVQATKTELASIGVPGVPYVDGIVGTGCMSILAGDRNQVESAGFCTWDSAEYLVHALRHVVRRMLEDFLDVDLVRQLVDPVDAVAPELVAATIPERLSWSELTDVLQRLVAEGVSIADMRQIFQALSEDAATKEDTVTMTERVRHALAPQITARALRGRDALPVLRVAHEIEQAFLRGIQRTAAGAYLSLAPADSGAVLSSVRRHLGATEVASKDVAILVTEVQIRPFIRRLVSLEFPELCVLSSQDLVDDTPIHVVGTIARDPGTCHLPPPGRTESL